MRFVYVSEYLDFNRTIAHRVPYRARPRRQR